MVKQGFQIKDKFLTGIENMKEFSSKPVNLEQKELKKSYRETKK